MNTPLLRVCVLVALLPLTAPAESGGPDPFGYSFAHSNSPASFQTIAFATGAVAVVAPGGAGSDDNSFVASIGFSFPFYGVDYTQVSINTNGLINLGPTTGGNQGNTDLNTTAPTGNRPAAALFWDDLNFPAAQPGGLWTRLRTNGGQQEFVVEWDRAACFGGQSAETITLQAIFRSDGTISFLYPDVTGPVANTGGLSATVGLRDITGQTNGRRLQNSFTTAYLRDGDRIDYTRTVPPDTEVQALDFSGQPVSPRVNTLEATVTGSDLDVPGVTEGKSVWFRWVAPTDGNVTFSTAGSTFDTVMAVKDPNIFMSVEGYDDDTNGDGTSLVGALPCAGGKVFLIMVAGKNVAGVVQSGLAQVTANFAPVERVGFAADVIQIYEGQNVNVQLQRAYVNRGSVNVIVQTTAPDGSTTSLGTLAIGDAPLTPIPLFPPDDAVFTPGRSYTLRILPDAAQYVITRGIITVQVLDNDAPALAGGTFTSVLESEDGNQLGNGLVTLKLGRTGSFTGSLTQGVVALGFKGQLDAFGQATLVLLRKGLPPLTLSVALTDGGTHFAFTLLGADREGRVQGVAAPTFSAKNKVPPALVGRYSLTEGDGSVAGYGYGTGTVAATGGVRFAGVLGDGTPFAFGTTLGAPDVALDHYVVAYTKTHGGKGFFQCNVPLGDAGPGQVFRPVGVVDKATNAFLAGYYDSPSVTLLRYTPPLVGVQVSPGFIASAGKGTFGLGTAPALTDTIDFTLALTGKATSPTAGFTLTLDRKTGLYKGTRPNPTVGGKPIPFGGILLQPTNVGTGDGTGFGISHDATTAHRAFLVPRP